MQPVPGQWGGEGCVRTSLKTQLCFPQRVGLFVERDSVILFFFFSNSHPKSEHLPLQPLCDELCFSLPPVRRAIVEPFGAEGISDFHYLSESELCLYHILCISHVLFCMFAYSRGHSSLRIPCLQNNTALCPARPISSGIFL